MTYSNKLVKERQAYWTERLKTEGADCENKATADYIVQKEAELDAYRHEVCAVRNNEEALRVEGFRQDHGRAIDVIFELKPLMPWLKTMAEMGLGIPEGNNISALVEAFSNLEPDQD